MDCNASSFRHEVSAARHPGGTGRALHPCRATVQQWFRESLLQMCTLIPFKDGKLETEKEGKEWDFLLVCWGLSQSLRNGHGERLGRNALFTNFRACPVKWITAVRNEN